MYRGHCGSGRTGHQIEKADNSPQLTVERLHAPVVCWFFINAVLHSGGLCNFSEPFNSVQVSSNAPDFLNTVPEGPCEVVSSIACLRVALPGALCRGAALGRQQGEHVPPGLPVEEIKHSFLFMSISTARRLPLPTCPFSTYPWKPDEFILLTSSPITRGLNCCWLWLSAAAGPCSSLPPQHSREQSLEINSKGLPPWVFCSSVCVCFILYSVSD